MDESEKLLLQKPERVRFRIGGDGERRVSGMNALDGRIENCDVRPIKQRISHGDRITRHCSLPIEVCLQCVEMVADERMSLICYNFHTLKTYFNRKGTV